MASQLFIGLHGSEDPTKATFQGWSWQLSGKASSQGSGNGRI
jgi:hypothetical protein